MTRARIERGSARPDLRRHVAVCMSCEHWQLDVRSAAISDLGGWLETMHAFAQAHLDHVPECPGAGGRVKFEGKWVERLTMQDGNPADGLMAMHPLPAWWVSR